MVTRRIVLVGGGHTHVQIVEAFGRAPLRGWRVILVSPDRISTYSGMVPGVVAGHYEPDELEIDLERLCAAHDVEFRPGRAIAIDRDARRLGLADGTTVPYHLLSLDVGSTTAAEGIAGACDHATPVKPVGGFLCRLEPIFQAAPGRTIRIAVIGGGPAGMEIALALRHRLHAAGQLADMALLAAGSILEDQPPRLRRHFRRLLARRGVATFENAPVAAVESRVLRLEDGRSLPSDFTVLATGTAPPAWLARTGLELCNGFVAVHPTLQTISDPDIFAAGDCAEITGYPRPKAGVFAVRAAPPLAANLRARATGRPLRQWSPQRAHLAILATGPRHAVAVRGGFFVAGRWVWLWKDRIDRNWVRRFRP